MNGVISVTHPDVQDTLLPFLERADPSSCKVRKKTKDVGVSMIQGEFIFILSCSGMSELFQELLSRRQLFILPANRRSLVADWFHLLPMHYRGCCLFATRSLLQRL